MQSTEISSRLKSLKHSYGNRFWRIQNLYKIRNKKRELTRLKFNNIQIRIVNYVEECIRLGKPIRKIDLKYRQGGVSTFWLIFYLDDTIFSRNTITGILADKRESLGYLFEIVRLAHAEMPAQVRPELGEDSKTALTFPRINSKIMVSLSIKGTALHNLHISEVCYCKDVEIQRTIGACPPSANITMESTGNGVGNYGYEICQEAMTGDSNNQFDFHPWFIQEEYRYPLLGAPAPVLTTKEKKLVDMAKKDYGIDIDAEQILFRRKKEKDLKGLYRQEFPETADDAFLTSGNKYFDKVKVMQLLKELREWKKTNQFAEETDDYTMFETPMKGDIYVAGADPAEGTGDFSVLKIINVSRRREAFVFRARVAVPTFFRKCDEWCRLYNMALLAVERNNHGHAVLLGLEQISHYPNIYKEEQKNRLGKAVFNDVGKPLPQFKSGWLTSNESRPLMLDHLKYGVEGEEEDDEDHFSPAITFFDECLLKELLTFEEVDGKLQAIEGKFDDDIFATAIAFQMYLRQVKYSYGQTNEGIVVAGERASKL